MKEYMTTLGTVMMLIALANSIIPEGSIKKFTSLAMGFMLIAATVSIIPTGGDKVFFTAESFTLSAEDIAVSEAEYKAEVIRRHRENIKNKIEEKIKHSSDVFVEVSPDGEIASVTLSLKGDESRAILYIVEELGVPRERIKLRYDKN